MSVDPRVGFCSTRNVMLETKKMIKMTKIGFRDIVHQKYREEITGSGEEDDGRVYTILAVIRSPSFVVGSTRQLRRVHLKKNEDETKQLVWNNFKLFLHTKLSNPHYPPEIQAEAALVNFSVTEDGLEDQLLTMVVEQERPDLASQRLELISQQNGFLIKMQQLEDDILFRLSTAKGDLTTNVELIEGLENTKAISVEIAKKSVIAKIMSGKINTISVVDFEML